eukprot:4843593-Prymnesium_polylepis.1
MCLDGDFGCEPFACFACVAGLASSAFASGLRLCVSIVVPRAASGVGLAECVVGSSLSHLLRRPVPRLLLVSRSGR